MKYVLKQKGEDCEETKARMAILPGMTLYGYCGGLFGRDSYGEKKILEVHEDHIVAREDGHTLVSRTIGSGTYTWSGIIEDSNRELEQAAKDEEYFNERYNGKKGL